MININSADDMAARSVLFGADATTPTITTSLASSSLSTSTSSPSFSSTPSTVDPSILATWPIASASRSSSPALSVKVESSPLMMDIDTPTPTTTTTASKRSSTASRRTSAATAGTASSKAADKVLDKEAKARERVLRNRAAAQESRDKKRKYVSEIEATNETLLNENSHLIKRLKTVEQDNLNLSQKLEALASQFSRLEQELHLSKILSSGVGFCQSAVLAKKDSSPSSMEGPPSNSPQQKLTPTVRNFQISSLHTPPPHSMTMTSQVKTSKKIQKKTRGLPDSVARPVAALKESASPRSRSIITKPMMSTQQRSTRNSFSAATASTLPTNNPRALQIVSQLMLTFSILFWISTGARSTTSNNNNSLPWTASALPPNMVSPLTVSQQRAAFMKLLHCLRLRRQALPLQQLSQLFNNQAPNNGNNSKSSFRSFPPQFRSTKDIINSLNQQCIDEIVMEYRLGRKDVARRLLAKALMR